MSDLPAAWIEVPFDEINDFRSQTIDPSVYPDEIFELYSVPTFPTRQPELLKGSEIGSTKQSVAPGDVLVCKINPRINRVWKVMPKSDKRQIASSEWIVMRAKAVHADYLRTFFSSQAFRETLCEDLTGVGGSLTRAQPKRVAKFRVPLAPLAEQRRIADKLEAVLGRVDACRARLDRVPAILKRFRQSVLAAATSGLLTEGWRQSEQPAEDWIETPLGSLIADGPKNGLYKPSTSYGQGTRILRIDNFYAGTINSWGGLKRLTVSDLELNDFGLCVGDIVVNRVNSMSHLGKSALVRELPEPCVFESNMMRVRLSVSRLLPEFCILILTSPGGIAQLQQNAKQAVNQASINQADVKSVVLALPSLGEQHEIVRRVEALFVFADRIEASLAKARAQVERLTPAVLAKAFRGELVPQDPKDEPASVLLERVRAERAVTALSKPRKAAGPGGGARKKKPAAPFTALYPPPPDSEEEPSLRAAETPPSYGKPASG